MAQRGHVRRDRLTGQDAGRIVLLSRPGSTRLPVPPVSAALAAWSKKWRAGRRGWHDLLMSLWWNWLTRWVLPNALQRYRRLKGSWLCRSRPHQMRWSQWGPICERCGYLPAIVRLAPTGPEFASVFLRHFDGQAEVGGLLEDEAGVTAG